MVMLQSDTEMLTSVKDFIGLSEDDNSFNKDLCIYINGAIDTLAQVGVGKSLNVTEESKWSNFITDPEPDSLGMIVQYVCLNVKILFDPPPPSTRDVLSGRIEEFLWRLQLQYSYREEV